MATGSDGELLGVGLQGDGNHSLFRGTSPPRLEGETIAGMAWHVQPVRGTGVPDLVPSGAMALMDDTAGFTIRLHLRGHAADCGAVRAVHHGDALAGQVARRQLSTRCMARTANRVMAVAVAAAGAVILIPDLFKRNENATTLWLDMEGGHQIASGTPSCAVLCVSNARRR